MTAILGYADGVTVRMGCDSSAVNGGWDRFVSEEKKVFHKGELLIGTSGQKRVNQVLRASLVAPEHPAQIGDHEYLIIDLVSAIRQCLDDAKSPMTGDEGGNALLIGYRGALYYMTHDYSVSKVAGGLFGIGAGSDLALGAFVACRMNALSVEGSMLKALEIAGKYNLTVAPPYYVECVGE